MDNDEKLSLLTVIDDGQREVLQEIVLTKISIIRQI